MKQFEYVRPKDVADAIQANSAHEGCRFLAGGSNLIDLMRYGVESAEQLVDISRLPLNKIEDLADGGLRIGALVRNSDLAADRRIVHRYPMLSQAILSGASPQIRNMATTGGNLLQRTRCYYFYDTALPCNKREPGSGCGAIGGFNRIHAILGQSDSCIAVNPSDMSVAMAALDATINVLGPQGRRSIPFAEFHRLPGDTPQIDTNLQPGELIASVDLPSVPVATHSLYLKIRDRQSYAFALVSVAAALKTEGGLIKEARVALGGVAHKPWRMDEAEKYLAHKPATDDFFRLAADSALASARGYEHNSFKIELAKRAIVRSLSELAGSEVS